MRQRAVCCWRTCSGEWRCVHDDVLFKVEQIVDGGAKLIADVAAAVYSCSVWVWGCGHIGVTPTATLLFALTPPQKF